MTSRVNNLGFVLSIFLGMKGRREGPRQQQQQQQQQQHFLKKS